MADGLNDIMHQLERQKTAIERALASLREVDAPAVGQVAPAPAPEAPARKGRKVSAASRRNMALAQRARWAKIKGEIEPVSPPTPAPPKPKRRISAEGMKRIIAATKKRWRLQRAAGKKVAVKAPSAKKAKKAAPVRKVVVKKSASAPAPTPVLAQAAD